jgi:hypothetical protein
MTNEKIAPSMSDLGDNTEEPQSDSGDSPMSRRGPRVRNTLDPSSTGAPSAGGASAEAALPLLQGGGAPWESPSAEQVKLMVQHLSPRGRDDDDSAEIRVGTEFQCPVPPFRPPAGADEHHAADERVGKLVWDPQLMPADGVCRYLERSATVRHPAEFPSDAALVHLHRCGYDADAAVDGLPGLADSALPDVKQLDAWTADDVHKFEEGVMRFGKDFRKIHIHMERKFPVPMVILFYFARWKKCPNFRVWQGRWKDYNKDECENCGKGGELLCCDGCPAAYHAACCHPPYTSIAGVPDADWYCMACVQRRNWLSRCRSALPVGGGAMKPPSFSHTPEGSLNIGAPFSPAARFLPKEPTPDIEDAGDAETDDTEGASSEREPPFTHPADSEHSAVSSGAAAAAAVAEQGAAARSATASQESPDVPVAAAARGGGASSSSSAAAAASAAARGRGRGGGSNKRSRTASNAAGRQGRSNTGAAGGDDDDVPTGASDDDVATAAAAGRGKKRKSRGPGTPTLDESYEQLAATAAGAAPPAVAPAGKAKAAAAAAAAATDSNATAAAARPSAGGATAAASAGNMGPFLKGEVVAVRGDPEEDAEAPFWLCAIYNTKKNDLDAAWCELHSLLCLSQPILPFQMTQTLRCHLHRLHGRLAPDPPLFSAVLPRAGTRPSVAKPWAQVYACGSLHGGTKSQLTQSSAGYVSAPGAATRSLKRNGSRAIPQ